MCLYIEKISYGSRVMSSCSQYFFFSLQEKEMCLYDNNNNFTLYMINLFMSPIPDNVSDGCLIFLFFHSVVHECCFNSTNFPVISIIFTVFHPFSLYQSSFKKIYKTSFLVKSKRLFLLPSWHPCFICLFFSILSFNSMPERLDNSGSQC